jgi:hypothetical protein
LATGNIASEGSLSDANVLGDSRDGPILYSAIGDSYSVRNVFGKGDVDHRETFRGGLMEAGVRLENPTSRSWWGCWLAVPATGAGEISEYHSGNGE